MEDYDKFVQHRLSHLRKSEEEHSKPLPASSLIRFYGQPILPPLLSGEQREKMQQHRDAAQKADVQRKLKGDSRMAYVQTILHSVQLRKTPTLEELLQESEINAKPSYSHNNSGGSVSQSDLFIGPKDDLLLSPPPGRKEQNGVLLPPLTSTTYSAFFPSNVTPEQSYQERCLIDQHYNQHGSQPSSLNGVSHQSVSSGYLTFENTTSVSERISAERESHGFGSSDGAYKNKMGGFFLHSTSETIAKMPDIISHPPIDGEELERSGLESSICNNIIVVNDICCTLLQEDSVICDHLPVEKSDSSHLDITEGEVNLSFTTVLNTEEDQSLGRIEGPVSLSESSDISDNRESSQTSSPHCIPTAELHIPHNPRESEPADNHADEAKPSEEPYRLSLQALLKKSQEYRRRQRMLRNQAKTTKIQERTQEQTRARAEEQSLSDKENDEFPYKGIVTADGKKAKERRDTLIPSVDTSQNKSWENERVIESEFFGEKANFKSQSSHLTGDGNTKEITSVEEEKILKNNKLNISQEILTEPKQINTFPQQQQPTSIETSPVQEAFYLTTCPKAFYSGVGKYHTIPAPNFCRSPVNCKSKGSIQDGDDGEAVDAVKISKRKVLVDSGLTEDHKVDEVNLGHKNSNSAVPFTGNLMVEGDVTSISARSSQHIDQLESNLSSLKIMISDLESTLTGNLKNHSQTESNTPNEVTFKGIRHSRQSDCDYWEDKLSNDDDSNEAEQDQKYREWQRRQLLDNFKNMQEDTETELNITATDNVSLITQVKETEAVNVSELRLIKTLATERGKEKGTCKEGFAKSYGQRGGCSMPTAKCILSVSQQQRIPNVFRNVPPATMVSPNVSVPLDTSNHQVESRNETAVDGHNSTYSPSINQSYDVEAPSGLWLLEGSGSDMGSKGHLVQEKHLTPESVGESQGGVSKVKRRLLMHMAKETRSADVSRRATSVVRPNASTPRVAEPLAAVRCYEGHGGPDKQEQLKQTHAAQVKALQDEHRRQQEELLQALAARYHLLQSVSFPCSMPSSRLRDTLTISPLSQPSSPLLEHCRPLLLAAVKGFLARRLLKTERVAQLVRTIRDTHQFLQALQQQSPGKGEFHSRQDLLLQERVTLQLRAARYEVHDIFFSLSAGERMQLINWDRELARERELRRQNGQTGNPRGKSSLSTATQKSLERKRGMMIQKKAAERHTGVLKRTGHNTGFSVEQPPETKRGQFRAKPQRVPRDTYSSRPR
ncbi:uncharacterized protein cp110 isoform X2 [Etheostoma spectabile]|uniref:uncharacterized protein cp110 isoform X2 n=1 Tax=Etheostoma spectabile TaxID=54343 RepID=UPI0013AF77F5|nr:uncharacterized protein LOC116695945 isoform X2 [Etheostoma spectabile]